MTKVLYKNNFKKLFLLSIILTVIIFIYGPMEVFHRIEFFDNLKDVETFTMYGSEYKKSEFNYNPLMEYIFENVNIEVIYYYIILALIGGVLLFGQEKSNGILEVERTMPIKDGEIFKTKVVSILTMLIIPFVINIIILIIGNIFKREYKWHYSIIDILNWFINYLIPILYFAALLIFAGVISGGATQQLIVSFQLLITAPLLSVFIEYIIRLFISGNLVSKDDILGRITHWIIGNLSFVGILEKSDSLAGSPKVKIILVLVTIFASYKLFKKTKYERTGELIQFKNLEKVIGSLVIIFLSLFTTVMIFENIIYGLELNINLIRIILMLLLIVSLRVFYNLNNRLINYFKNT